MHFLAFLILGAVAALGAEPVRLAVDEWVVDLRSEVSRVRCRAAVALGRSGDASAAEPLIAALTDSDAGVRREVARALGTLRVAKAAVALTKALTDADPNVRFYAAFALGEVRVPTSVAALLRVLVEDPDPGVRGQAAWALRELRPADLVDSLLAALRQDAVDVRQIAWVLKHTEGPRPAEGLQALAQDADARIRCRALAALGEFGADVGAGGCLAALGDADPSVRLAAVRALARMRTQRVTEALRAHLAREEDPVVRETIQALVPAGPTPGALLAHWSFDDRDPARAREVTGHGPDGEIKGATVTEGRIGAALHFAGAAHVALGHPASLPIQDAPFTVTAWIRPEAPTGVVVAWGGAFCGYALYLKDGKPLFGIHRERDGPAYIAGGGEPLPEGWIHLAGVVDSQAIRLYVEGRLSAETAIPGLIPTTPGQGMEIGSDLGTSPAEITDGFVGAIDEVKVYDGALGAEQVANEAAGQR
jgi:HEAT repeat protein